MIQELMKLGFKTNEAKCMSVLMDGKEHRAHELEKKTGLRQPEVSIALKQLNERGYLRIVETEPVSKGRPHKLISLAEPPSVIILWLESDIRNECAEKLDIVQGLIKMTAVHEEKNPST